MWLELGMRIAGVNGHRILKEVRLILLGFASFLFVNFCVGVGVGVASRGSSLKTTHTSVKAMVGLCIQIGSWKRCVFVV